MAEIFGRTKDGQQVTAYLLKNKNGMEAKVLDYGATLVSLMVPDREGVVRDVVLGYDEVSGYETGTCYFGATVGRVANRIGKAQFQLNGTVYQLTKNDNGNSLHGGRDYMNQRMWETEKVSEQEITFLLHSPDGDQGYPGAVDIRVTYTVTDADELKIHYHAVPEADTLLNLTNHSYFNLNGHRSGPATGQKARILAQAFTQADAESIPTGEIVSVAGTPMDFRTAKTIGQEIDADYEPLILGKGYDHNWVLDGTGFRKVAEMASDESGICMEVSTDLPGMQFYTGNFVEKESGKGGSIYGKRQGVCFETQYFPDAVNKENFESPVTKAGEVYDTTTVYRFIKSS